QKARAKSVDVAGLINRILEHVTPVANIKKIELVFTKSTENAIATVNEFTVSKAIENLIDNAIAYSNEGGKITIELGEAEGKLTLKVSDQGIGIPENQKASIFQQFFRASNAVKKKNVGSGLGLFLVKSIIEGH